MLSGCDTTTPQALLTCTTKLEIRGHTLGPTTEFLDRGGGARRRWAFGYAQQAMPRARDSHASSGLLSCSNCSPAVCVPPLPSPASIPAPHRACSARARRAPTSKQTSTTNHTNHAPAAQSWHLTKQHTINTMNTNSSTHPHSDPPIHFNSPDPRLTPSARSSRCVCVCVQAWSGVVVAVGLSQPSAPPRLKSSWCVGFSRV